MATSVVTCLKTSLPRALDVSVSISRPLTEIATDMTMLCFVTPSVDFEPDANRIKYFSSLEAVADECGISTPAYYAASAFFARNDRPTTMAVGKVFKNSIQGKLTTGSILISDLTSISNGSFHITVGDNYYEVENCDFTSLTTLNQIADAVNTGLAKNGVPATALATSTGLAIMTDAKGDGAEISYMTAGDEHDAQPAYLITGEIDIDALKEIEAGYCKIIATVNRIPYTFTVGPCNFTGIQTLSDATTILQEQSDLAQMHLVVSVVDETKIKAQTIITGNVEISYLLPIENPTAGQASVLTTGDITRTNLVTIYNGAFTIPVGGENYNVANLDFRNATSMQEVCDVINSEMEELSIPVTVSTEGESNKIKFTASHMGTEYNLDYLSFEEVTQYGYCYQLSVDGAYPGKIWIDRLPDGVTEYDGDANTPYWNSIPAILKREGNTDIADNDVFDDSTYGSGTPKYVIYRDLLPAVRDANDDADVSASTDVSGLLMGTEITATSLTMGVDPRQNMNTELMGVEGSTTAKVDGTAATVNVATLLKGTSSTASSLYSGYTPGDLASELSLISKAGKCNGRPVFGWVLDAIYRDTEAQKLASDWAEAQDPAYLSLCSNDVNCYNPSNSSNIAYYCHDRNYKNVSVIYHHAPEQYPDMSYIALALSVNYALQDSTLTMKFKQLDGISTSPLTETQVSNLDNNNCNCYVLMGNNSSVVREGKQSADTWFTDSMVNLANYKEELQVEVYNVFLRNKKIPYTTTGQNKLVSACAKINSRYTTNGTFADREVENPESENGYEVLPATSIIPVSVASATASDRASRLAPPIAITAYEAGAFHKVAIAVNVYN